MLDHSGLAEVSLPLGKLLLAVELIELGLLLPERYDCALLVLPLKAEGIVLRLHLGKLLADLLEPFLRPLVILTGQRLLLDRELQHLPVERIELRRLALDLHLDLRGRLIDKVDGLIRQEPVGKVPIGKDGSGDEGLILDAHAMMQLILRLEAAQDGNRILD